MSGHGKGKLENIGNHIVVFLNSEEILWMIGLRDTEIQAPGHDALPHIPSTVRVLTPLYDRRQFPVRHVDFYAMFSGPRS